MRYLFRLSVGGVLGAIFLVCPAGGAGPAGIWQTQAQWHRTLRRAVKGTLLAGPDAIEFRSSKLTARWRYADIHTLDLLRHGLTLTSYENRRWHEPGERRYRFTFTDALPAAVAAELAERVGKPIRNRVPADTGSFAEIPAHLRARFGGSSGTLRLKDSGIDYVTGDGRDSRSWRWTDIQTIANPNPFELRVTAYREIAEFELKHPLRRPLFERLWDHLYAAGLNVSAEGRPAR